MGEEVWFWDDIWCGNSSLKYDFRNIFLLVINRQGVVTDNFMRVGEGVYYPRLRRNLNDWERVNWLNLLHQLEDYKPIIRKRDKHIWGLNKKCLFSTKSFYEDLEQVLHVENSHKGIWTQGIPSKINFFLWTAALKKILTLNHLKNR